MHTDKNKVVWDCSNFGVVSDIGTWSDEAISQCEEKDCATFYIKVLQIRHTLETARARGAFSTEEIPQQLVDTVIVCIQIFEELYKEIPDDMHYDGRPWHRLCAVIRLSDALCKLREATRDWLQPRGYNWTIDRMKMAYPKGYMSSLPIRYNNVAWSKSVSNIAHDEPKEEEASAVKAEEQKATAEKPEPTLSTHSPIVVGTAEFYKLF